MRRPQLGLEPYPPSHDTAQEQAFSGECRCRFRSVPLHYKVIALPDVRVRMRDGVEIAVRITRPDVEGIFPAVLACSPYRTLGLLKPAISDREYSNHTNAPTHLAEHGYVCVNYDVRGTGNSGGFSADMYSDLDRSDAYDMVEWIAAQPWCTGKVGMWGFSYGGVVTWQVAALAPPHLAAVIVGSGTGEVYRDWTFPGGVPRPFAMFGAYAAGMAASIFAPPDRDFSAERWSELWQERLDRSAPWSIEFLKHQTDDAYWQARSAGPHYDRIKCPVFVLAGWADYYPTAELRAFTKLRGPKKALIGPWAHYWPEDAFPGPRLDARSEYLKWFDQFLKGAETGVLREPPVTIFVGHYQPPAPMYTEVLGSWRQEFEWPLARTHYTSLYLSASARLEWQAQGDDEGHDNYRYRASVGAMSGILAGADISPWAMPLDQRWDEAQSLVYTSEPLEADLETTGNPTAELFVSSSSDVAYFAVRLCDVAPDGTSKLISDGGLNATHRSSHSRPEPLTPGHVHKLRFDLRSVAYVFPAGHRIRIAVTSADFQNAWPVSKTAINTLVRGGKFRSRVILPVVTPRSPALPLPDVVPSPNPLPASIARPEHSVTYDLINGTMTLSISQGSSQTTYTVSDVDPAAAVLKSAAVYVVPGAGAEIKVAAYAVTESDAKVFRHLVDVEVTVDGRRHFSKSWSVSVPRSFN
jgi:uncharacterized protein